MNRVQPAALAVIALSSAVFAGPPGPTSDGMPRYEDFEKRVVFPYRAPTERAKKISEGAKLLRSCMTKREVEATLGKPDFSRSMFGPKGPGEKWLGFSWTYYLAKTGSTTNSKDPGIEVFFDTSDRAHWIVPTGIEGAREIGAPARPCARAPDNGNAADNAEIRKLKARALEGMRRYMDVVRQSGKDPGYGEAEIRRCEVILDTYVRRLSTISRGDNAQVMAATKDAVLALNKLNGETGERLIETDQREDLAMLINKAARAMGVGDGKGDITEQWREW